MNRVTHRAFADAFCKARRGEDSRGEFLTLAKPLHQEGKDFREIYSRGVATLYPDDEELRAAYAAHRKGGINPDEVAQRTATVLDSLAQPNNPLSCPDVLDALTEAQAVVRPADPPALPKRGPIRLCDLARHFAAARLSPGARTVMARGLYRGNGTLTKATAALFEGRDWLRQHVEAILGDARPQPRTGGARAALLRSWEGVKDSVRELQPAFVFFAVTVVGLVVALVVLTFVLGKASAHSNAPTPAAEPAPAAEADALEVFGRQVAALGDQLKDCAIVVLPHARDDSDKRLAEVLSAQAKGARVVPWSAAREALGADVPAYDGAWLTDDDLRALPRTLMSADDKPSPKFQGVLIADAEPLGDGRARVSLFGYFPERVVCSVSGKAANVRSGRGSGWYLARAESEFSADYKGRLVGLYARQARAAARDDAELGRALLFQGQLSLCQDRRGEAQAAFARAYPLLGEAERQAIPDPIRKEIASGALTPKERVRGLMELKPAGEKGGQHGGAG
jgi:hypothetical protein